MYTIYRITSPSGRFYIGLTSQDVNVRWGQHKRRAKFEKRNHPFYNAIRKYGSDAFIVEAIDHAKTKAEAQQLEVSWIAKYPIELLYNVSPGGEADGETGSKTFWDSIRRDTTRYHDYLQKLSSAKKQSDWTNYQYLSGKAAEWRKANPKEAYRISYRAARCARRANKRACGVLQDNRPFKDRLMWKFKPDEAKSRQASTNTARVWVERSPEDIKSISKKISESAKSNWERITDPETRSKKTQAARDAIDRSKQGPAASKGLKNFWSELKKDPERYREYIQRRSQSANAAKKHKKEDI